MRAHTHTHTHTQIRVHTLNLAAVLVRCIVTQAEVQNKPTYGHVAVRFGIDQQQYATGNSHQFHIFASAFFL